MPKDETYVTDSPTVTDYNQDDYNALCATIMQRYAQSPILSNLTDFSLPNLFVQVGSHLRLSAQHYYTWTMNDIESILTSPMMSNNLIELDLSDARSAVNDQLLETILTMRVIPGDESSPLKFGNVQKLNLQRSSIGARGVELIVQNLKELTHLDLSYNRNIDDEAITALIGDEHVDLQFPSPSLPNLIDLHLHFCAITDNGCMKLSKSQLLHQLKGLSYQSYLTTSLGLDLVAKSMKDPA